MEELKVIKWKKTGGGSFRMGNGRIIKPGQIFTAREDEIPQAFRNIIIPLDPSEVRNQPLNPQDVDPDKPLKVTKEEYKKVPRGKSKSWFDIVKVSDGKILNTKALTNEKADEFLRTLV